MSKKVKVYVSCGCYVGEPKWKRGTDWYKEPDECNWEGIIEVEKDEWDEECVSVYCPSCNAELHQLDDHFQLCE